MQPVIMTTTLVTEDGVPIDAVHLPASAVPAPEELSPPGTPAGMPAGGRDFAIVLAHGFTLSWQRPMMWTIAQRFTRAAGVVTFDFRGHGRSGGLTTLGDKEVLDLDVAVRYAREPKELWLIPGFGHAERHTDDALTDRIAAWATAAVAAQPAS